MSSFNLLSTAIKKYVRDKRWEELRPIQEASIQRILTTDSNYILTSKTASGKTEAAFLPILSKVNFNDKGIQVLYISPLIALINDQFNRIEELCHYLEVPVTKWHGEASRSLKEKIIKEPSGVVLITPESLEAMFVNKPYNIKLLFGELKYIVIDEIHSFIGTDRGIQLKSILSRMQEINSANFKVVGLSATLGDFEQAKAFTGFPLDTKILLDKTAKEIKVQFRYFQEVGSELPLELLKDLYIETKDHKVLIFPNSRGKVEEVAVKLRKISNRLQGHLNYFSHHSSVDKEVREYVEYFAKNNRRSNFCIACTSTLELGIDIGSVDEVVQIDATYSIASLIQRVGRSGRKDGSPSSLFLYATNQWSLLQSLASWLLYKEGFIEPPEPESKAYDILLHQILSIVKGYSGIDVNILLLKLKNNYAFSDIEEKDIKHIINHLLKIDFLENLQNEVIIGIEGEKIVNSRDFYSAFTIEETFKVIHNGNKIGDLPFSPQIIENENILLAAKIWKITYVELNSKKIEVIPANDGKKPTFSGNGGYVHNRIREKMYSLLYSTEIFEFLDKKSSEALTVMRSDFSIYKIGDLTLERPTFANDKKTVLYTFCGTKINRTLSLLFSIVGIKNIMDDSNSTLYIQVEYSDFFSKWQLLVDNADVLEEMLTKFLKENNDALSLTKWGNYLPTEYQIELMKRNYFDIEFTRKLLLKDITLINPT